MKLFLSGVIFCCFVLIGHFIRRAYRLRKQFFENLVRFCDNLVTEIGFSKRTVTQIIDAYIDGYGAQFTEMLLNYKNLVESSQDITRENMVLWGALTQAEQRVIADFFWDLGKHSAAEEIEKIKNFRSRFEVFRADAAEKLKRDASIYFKICVLVGIGVVIVLL